MSILSAASSASAWRGYDYYINKNVVSFARVSEDEYEGLVAGSTREPYRVKIHTAHTRSSRCSCPFANGTRKICKHMVALYFTAFPEEAETYIAEMERYAREEEARMERHYAQVQAYVRGLSKKELQERLFQALVELEERDNGDWQSFDQW